MIGRQQHPLESASEMTLNEHRISIRPNRQLSLLLKCPTYSTGACSHRITIHISRRFFIELSVIHGLGAAFDVGLSDFIIEEKLTYKHLQWCVVNDPGDLAVIFL